MDQIERVLNLIKDEDLERLGKLSEVDKCNTKLLGKIIFKGLMKLILMGQKTSLRGCPETSKFKHIPSLT